MSSMSFLFETCMKIFFEDNIFRAVIGSQQNHEEGTEISHMLSAPQMPPPLSTSPLSGTFVILDGPALAHHSPPESIILQFTLTLYGFGVNSCEIFTGLNHPQGNSKAQKLFCLLESFTYC